MNISIHTNAADPVERNRPSRVVRLLLAMTNSRSQVSECSADEFPFLNELRPARMSQREFRDSQLIERRLTS